MGCGISKFDRDEARLRPTCTEEVKSLLKQNDCTILCEYDGCVRPKEGDSLASCGRKSTSSATNGRGFLKRVLGSDEKERGTERDLQPVNANTRNSSGKQDRMVLNVNDVRDQEQLKRGNFDKDSNEKEGFHQEKIPDKIIEKEEAITSDDGKNPEGNRQSEEEEDTREEDSILFNLRSPSFKIYCVDHEHIDAAAEDSIGEEREDKPVEENKKKESEMTQPMKRQRKRRIHNIWIVSHRIHNYYFFSNMETAEKSGGKTA